MAVQSSQGRGWNLPGGFSAIGSSASSEINNIRVYSRRGTSAPGVLGSTPLPQIGTPIPGTALVYVRPRLSQDELGALGGDQFPYQAYRWPGTAMQVTDNKPGYKISPSVHITNVAFSMYQERRRTPSIGMARAGQVGLSMGVPYEPNTPYFSVA